MRPVGQRLSEADRLLHEGIDEERTLLIRAASPVLVNREKYERALRLFEEILETDPGNPRAVKGVEICGIMLTVDTPVQYIAPLPEFDAGLEELLKPVENSGAAACFPAGGDAENAAVRHDPAADRMPWEIRGEMLSADRARDRTGVAYTSRVFAAESAGAKEQADALVREGAAADTWDGFCAVLEKLTALQEKLHRSWKGHGPGILEDAVRDLVEISNPSLGIKRKIERVKGIRERCEPECVTVAPDAVGLFADIFAYLNESLRGFHAWYDETLSFYSSVRIGIEVFSDGTYCIEAGFPGHPDKESDSVFVPLDDFNRHREPDCSLTSDLLFLVRVHDVFFTSDDDGSRGTA